MKKKNDIFKLIIQSKRVNNYTKLMLFLNTLDYYNDYYISNTKLCKILKLEKSQCIKLLKQLEEDKIIKIYYRGRKKYFSFIGKPKEKKPKKDNIDIFTYDWLND